MPTISVKPQSTPDKSYNIFVQNGCIDKLHDFLKKEKLGDDYALITDSRTEKLFGKSLANSLRKKGLRVEIISFEAGEKSKTLTTVSQSPRARETIA